MASKMTLGKIYNYKAQSLMPHMADDLLVDPKMLWPDQIDQEVFGRSEYLGGMAAVILAIIESEG